MGADLEKYFKCLSIGGSDSGGGAGIQADLKTFSALGCYGMSVITALTAQNTKQVRAIFDVDANFVKEQIDAVFSDIGVDTVKIGMVHTPEIICTVADRLRHYKPKFVVLDPVMVAKSGDRLLHDDAIHTLKNQLFPLANVLTPNLPETSIILGRDIQTPHEMEEAASELQNLGPKIVVIKGGHAIDSESNDYVQFENQGQWFKSKRIQTRNTHGTGCTFSSAIAAFLARGLSPAAAIHEAKTYLQGAIEAGATYHLGEGHGPLHHFYKTWGSNLIKGNS